MNFSGRKLRIWSDEERSYGLFDIGFEEPVVVRMSKSEAAYLTGFDNISFSVKKGVRRSAKGIYDSRGTEVIADSMSTVISSYKRMQDIAPKVIGCQRFYNYESDSLYWYLPKNCVERLEVALESYWRRRTWQMEYLYTGKKAGFFLTYAGKSYYVPRGESLSFYRHGIWNSGFNNTYGLLASYMSSAVSFCGNEKLLSQGLRVTLQKGSLFFLVLGGLFQAILLYIWSFRKKGTRWSPFYKNEAIRLGIRLMYGYYLHGLLPVVEHWQRIVKVSKSRGISERQLDSLIRKVLQDVANTREVYLRRCEEMLNSAPGTYSLGYLKRVKACLELYLLLLDKPRLSLQLWGPLTVKFDSVGAVSKGFSNVMTRRSLFIAPARRGSVNNGIPMSDGTLGVLAGKGVHLPPYDARVEKRALAVSGFASGAIIEKKIARAIAAVGLKK